jgi:hypothetical protein
MKASFLYIFFLFIAISCVHKENKNGNPRNNTRTIILKDINNTVNLSQLINEIHYIPLETTSESLIGEISNIKLFDNTFFVLSETGTSSVIKTFSSNGKFSEYFGKYGEGANEIYRPRDIVRNNDLYFVLDNTGIHSFSRNGIYLKRMFINKYNCRKFFYYDRNFYLLHGLSVPGLFSKVDLHGNLIKTFLPLNVWIGTTEEDKIIAIGSKLHVFTPNLDTIYELSLNNEEFRPAYYVKAEGIPTLGELIYKNKDLNPYELVNVINTKEHAEISNFLENKRYLYVEYYYKRRITSYVLNKTTNKGIYFSHFLNDVDNGYFGSPILMTTHNELIIPLYPYKLIEYFKKNKNLIKNKDNQLWEIVKIIKVDDNPILMKCKLIL